MDNIARTKKYRDSFQVFKSREHKRTIHEENGDKLILISSKQAGLIPNQLD